MDWGCSDPSGRRSGSPGIANLDEADRISDDRRRIVLVFYDTYEPLPFAPVRDPWNFLHRRAHQAGTHEFFETARGQGRCGAPFCDEELWVEGNWIRATPGQGSEFRKALGVVQDADDP